MQKIILSLSFLLVIQVPVLLAQTKQMKMDNKQFIQRCEQDLKDHDPKRALIDLKVLHSYSSDVCKYEKEFEHLNDSLYFAGYKLHRSGRYYSTSKDKRTHNSVIANFTEIGEKYKFDVVVMSFPLFFDGTCTAYYYRLESIKNVWKNPPENLESSGIYFEHTRNRVVITPTEYDYCKEKATMIDCSKCCTRFSYWYLPFETKIDFRTLTSHSRKFSMYRAGKLVCELEIKGTGNYTEPVVIMNGEVYDYWEETRAQEADYKKKFEGAELDQLKNAVVHYFRFNPNERCKYPIKSSDWTKPVTDERQGPTDNWEMTPDLSYEGQGVQYKISGSYWCNVSETEQVVFPIDIYTGKRAIPNELRVVDDPENPKQKAP